MRVFTNGLTDAQQERLSLLLEEMGEAIQIVGKIQRHGYASHNPDAHGDGSNLDMLEKELGDVRQAIDLMIRARDVREPWIDARVEKRWVKVQRYLHHQPHALFVEIAKAGAR